MSLSQLFQERRQKRGFTQAQVAKVLEVTPQYVSDVECGRKVPADFKRVLKWAIYLGISQRDLLLYG